MTANRMRVLVVGAGPAGCAVSIRLAHLGADVDMIWHGDTQAALETLPAHAKPLLLSLGLSDQTLRTHASSPGVLSLWEDSQPTENESIWNPHGDSLIVDRPVLDKQLRDQAAKCGVHLMNKVRIGACNWDQSQAQWQLQLMRPDQTQMLPFHWVIDATGRSAWLARRLGAIQEQRDQLVGLLGSMPPRSLSERRLILEAQSQGWLYLLHSNQSTVVGVMLDAIDVPPNRSAALERWRRQLECSMFCHAFCDVSLHEFRVTKAGSSRLNKPVGDRWVAVGDAAAAWDPLSSQGLAQSLNSGWRAAEVVTGSAPNRQQYAEWYADTWSDYLTTYKHYYERAAHRYSSAFWTRRL